MFAIVYPGKRGPLRRRGSMTLARSSAALSVFVVLQTPPSVAASTAGDRADASGPTSTVAAAERATDTDFNGDGLDDIATFVQGTIADSYVALSTGSRFFPSPQALLWHGDLGRGSDIIGHGDFNGDGRDDIATFTRGSRADVNVALSTGGHFGPVRKWHDGFAQHSEIPAVGDVNGDGRDDIITFTGGSRNDVYVALSNGTTFGRGLKWHDWFNMDGERPLVGDFNGDGRADIATNPYLSEVMWVATSVGNAFTRSAVWYTAGERLLAWNYVAVGDIDGDRRDDLIAMDLKGQVRVIRSSGSGFNPAGPWQNAFSTVTFYRQQPHSILGVGQFTGDGRADLVLFDRRRARVLVAVATSAGFASPTTWQTYFAPGREMPVPYGNVNDALYGPPEPIG